MSMRVLVTGSAGFIGSHLCERLLSEGHQVLGIDCFTDYYPRWFKERNLASLRTRQQFEFIESDLVHVDWQKQLPGLDAIFHQAAQAGVRASWGATFESYTHHNIIATQVLLEALKEFPHTRVIFASSSSVYGETQKIPMEETDVPRPVSPYGVTKLAAEHLCRLYWVNYGVPTVMLRYFTVYGPRQRPDMAFHKFLLAALNDETIQIYGDGTQSRDFTYITDAVNANLAALEHGKEGEVYNIGGGSQIVLNQALEILSQVVGKKLKLEYQVAQKGDVSQTRASIAKSRDQLNYLPEVSLSAGLKEEWHWLKQLYTQ